MVQGIFLILKGIKYKKLKETKKTSPRLCSQGGKLPFVQGVA
jgi:hypothetical protein